MLAGLVVVALGPASAQVERSTPSRTLVKAPATQAAQPTKIVPLQAATQVAYARPSYQAPTGFAAYKNWLMHRARQEGVREATIQAHVPSLDLNSRAIELDRAQRPTPRSSNSIPSLAPYIRDHVTASLISRGQTRYSSYWPRLSQVYARYGVDPAILMAIYGKETSYGAVTGGFDLLEALASLAYEGRRRQLFEGEFLAALKLVDSGVPRWRLKGSYAGATGYPQFMPSVVLRLRADGDGDGYADIWSSEVDALASIANYLRDAGWKPGVPWGAAVHVPPTLNRAAIRSTLAPSRCPAVFQRHSRWQTVGEWRAMGVVPYRTALPANEMATLMEPDGPGATAYLLTNNSRAILEYNCSNFYAMSVALLADRIARR
jgi:membrane-bound lytic murein transglycosylase B